MAVKLPHYHQSAFASSSSCNPRFSGNDAGGSSCRRVAELDYLFRNCGGNSSKRHHLRLAGLDNRNCCLRHQLVGCREVFPSFRRLTRSGHLLPRASSDEGATINGSTQSSARGKVEEMRLKLNQSLQGKEYNDGLVQALHDAARVFELALKEQGSLSKLSWLSTAWLGVDKNAWIKSISYQASVYSLLQAACEISSRGDGRDRDVYVFVQRSLLRQSAPLESLIRDKLLAKQPEGYDWFLSEQVPVVVSSFVNCFEEDQRFAPATAMSAMGSGNASDISILMLALTCIATITKLGPAKVSCPQFVSMIPEITGRLMDMLVNLVPISEAYLAVRDIGLRREFLVHFGPRASACRVKSDGGSEEVVFWVDLVQEHLQRAIDREKIWSRLTTSESIEVLERDLAIFGFFIALGRSTKSYLLTNGFDVIDESLESFIRYLIGGSVLYYPQLSSISSYQLFVEVVCEELDWLPFYPGSSSTQRQLHGHKSKEEGPPNPEAVPQVLDICSHWMQSFIKYSKWLESPTNVKAAKFLSRGHNKLADCFKELGISKNAVIERAGSGSYSSVEKASDSFDKALESVEEALIRLEGLLQELHMSSSSSKKEQLKAACTDLEKIRKLKKEAEFLEVSFRAKAASLQQGDEDGESQSSNSEQPQFLKEKKRSSSMVQDKSNSKSSGLFGIFIRPRRQKPDVEISAPDGYGNVYEEQKNSSIGVADSESSEIRRFELLRRELIELEKRVQKSSVQSENEEDIKVMNNGTEYVDESGGSQLVQVQKNESIIERSFDKLKETTTDVWQGTQLLAIDVAAAMGLLRRSLVGDELTEKEKKALRRTLTDLASVVPIGVLMLLPVTAVGHAAMLAAIQRYVPSLIPSTYGPERLDLLRQLEKVKEIETSEVDPDENVGGLA